MGIQLCSNKGTGPLYLNPSTELSVKW